MEAQRIANAGVQILNACSASYAGRARLAAEAASAHASSVDAAARFPSEAFAEIRKQRLLGIMVPETLGGEGATLAEIADVCFILGQSCASSALIFAMHQIKMACIIRHAKGTPALERILRQVAEEQLLLASSTTEGQAGGNVRSSEAPVEYAGDQVTLERKATVISYAMEADGVVTTARRASDAAASDQVLVVLLKKDYTLERLQSLGYPGYAGDPQRGIHLAGSRSRAADPPEPYEKIHRETMVPHAHLLWGSVWTGIAAAATAKAQAFVRNALRASGGQMPPGAAHFTQAASSLRTCGAC